MTKQTYAGSCACGAVKLQADLDLSQPTGKCNCTKCWKRRWWSARARPEELRVVQGEDALAKLQHAAGYHSFCKQCGTGLFGMAEAAEWNDGAFASVNVAILDDLPVADLLAAPVQYFDGLHDNWWNPPTETRHL